MQNHPLNVRGRNATAITERPATFTCSYGNVCNCSSPTRLKILHGVSCIQSVADRCVLSSSDTHFRIIVPVSPPHNQRSSPLKVATNYSYFYDILILWK